jgi:hypothetical protein
MPVAICFSSFKPSSPGPGPPSPRPGFTVRDANKQALAFVYCEDEPGRRTTAKLLTRDEARRIAANIAKLPEFDLHQSAFKILVL